MVFTVLINNIALLLTLSFLYNLINRSWEIRSIFNRLLSGVLFGFFTIIGMMNSLNLMPGIIFDGRSIIISIAGLFGGPVTALITVLISAAYRIYIGGSGVVMGVSVITSSAVVGVWFYYLRKKTELIVKPLNLWLFSVVVHVVMLVLTIALPSRVSFEVLGVIAVPVLVIYPVGSVLICLFFLNNEERVKNLNALKKSEEEIKKINQTLQVALDATESSAFENNLITGEVLNTPGAYIKMGYSPEEIPKTMDKLMKLVHPDDIPAVYEKIEEHFKGLTPFYNSEFRMKDKTGKWRWLNGKGKIVERDEKGNAVKLIGLSVEITDFKLAQDALRESEGKFRSYIQNAPVAIFILNSDGEFQQVNQLACSYTGYSEEELLQMNASQLITPEGLEKAHRHFASSEDGKISDDFTFLQKDGSFFYMSVDAVRISENSILVFCIDITERIQIQEELIKAKDRAENSDRLKSEFLAQMSHEIRTPINAILSFSSLLREEISDQITGDLATSFTVIRRAGDRIIRTIDLILNMSEIQTGTYESNFTTFDICRECLNALYLEFSKMAGERGIQLNINISPGDSHIYADLYTVNQIFNNLIHNAVKYTPEGKIDINVFRDMSQSLTVEIADTGIGISGEYLPDLFSPFTQEEQGYGRKFEGNGLGLALVKKYCEINNAEITVQSEKGKGTVFIVKFQAI